MTLQQEVADMRAKADKIDRLLARFPDLVAHHDRWNNRRYAAKSATAATTDVHLHHSCGCCNDAVLYARPFLVVEGERVHSDPSVFNVGEKVPGQVFRNRGYDGWADNMAAAGVPQTVIDQVAAYLRASATAEDDDADTEACAVSAEDSEAMF